MKRLNMSAFKYIAMILLVGITITAFACFGYMVELINILNNSGIDASSAAFSASLYFMVGIASFVAIFWLGLSLINDIIDKKRMQIIEETISSINKKTCPKCGKILKRDEKFCSNCGQKIDYEN